MKLERIHELADRYCREELNELDHKELELLLTVKGEDCHRFLDYLYETNQLVLIAKQLEALGIDTRPRRITPIRFAMAIAALFLIGIATYLWLPQEVAPDVKARRPLLAKLIHMKAPEGQELREAQWLQAGSYSLPQGKYQLAFTNGTKVKLIGESDFALNSVKEMQLSKGHLIAKVTQEAKTFTVFTPSAKVEDLGTVFMVKIDPEQHSNVLVKEGVVKVSSLLHEASQVLQKNESLRVLKNGHFENIENVESVFDLSEPLPSKLQNRENLSWFHWDFEQDLKAKNQRMRISPNKKLFPPKYNEMSMPKVCESPFGKGLRFDGKNDGLNSKYSGIGGNEARTMSLWVRLPAHKGEHRKSCFFYYGNHQEDGRKWQLTTNSRSQDGPRGALRLELRQGYITGSTNLFDGRWHHIAVVFIGGYTSDVATHVMMYVDGALETISDYRHKVVDTDTSSKISDKFSLGMYHGDVHDSLDGDIDELWVFNQALMSEEIIRLRDYNSPFEPQLH